MQEAGLEIVRVCGADKCVHALHNVLYQPQGVHCSHCEAKTHKILQKHSQYAEEKEGKGSEKGGEIAFGTDDALKTERKLQTLL